MKLCHGEMELDPLEGAVGVQVEAWVKEEAGVEWEAPGLELVPVGNVSVPIVVLSCSIKWAHPATA